MKQACIAYTTDVGYLFPSLLSATQAKANVVSDRTDVAICYIGEATYESDVVKSVCAENEILFYQISADQIDNLHVMYARLFLDQVLGKNYSRIVYIDGDTQITGDLQSLADAEIATGMVLAARDPMTLSIGSDCREGRETYGYFKSIGLSTDQTYRYFNSGVMCFNMADWAEIREECMDFKRRNSRAYNFPDQDILNLCLLERQLTLSFKWNFPAHFMNHAGVEQIVNPNIYHFMSNPRPWQGPFLPWGSAYTRKYEYLKGKYPVLKSIDVSLPLWKRQKYVLQQYYKFFQARLKWNSSEIIEKIQRIEATAFF